MERREHDRHCLSDDAEPQAYAQSRLSLYVLDGKF